MFAKVAHYAAAAGADKLAPRAYDPVPLGAVMPSGWMKNRESDHEVGTPPCTSPSLSCSRARYEPCQLSLLRCAFADDGLYHRRVRRCRAGRAGGRAVRQPLPGRVPCYRRGWRWRQPRHRLQVARRQGLQRPGRELRLLAQRVPAAGGAARRRRQDGRDQSPNGARSSLYPVP